MEKINNSENKNLIEVYKTSKGIKFFAHSNILDISPARGIAASRADRFVGLRLSQSNMEAILDNAIEGINKRQDFVNAVAILHELKQRCHYLTEESSLLDLACIYYFLEDEDPRYPSEHHNKIKRDIFESDFEANSFFLQMSLQLTKQFSSTPEEDLLKFLQESRQIAENIYQFIPKQ